MLIPEGDFRAYLFDCDGTIADTMPIHYKAWCEALAPWNCEFPVDLFYDWAGIPGEKITQMLGERSGITLPESEIVHRKEEAYFQRLDEVRPVAAVLAQIEKQSGKIPLAVVSGSPRDSVLKTLGVLGLVDRFATIVGAEDYVKGKPAPDPFLLAASRLNIPPQHCLVFEDADLGVQSAQAAGMAWVKVTSQRI